MRVKSGYCPSSEEHVYPPRIMSLSDSDLEGEDGQLQSEYHPMTGVQGVSRSATYYPCIIVRVVNQNRVSGPGSRHYR